MSGGIRWGIASLQLIQESPFPLALVEIQQATKVYQLGETDIHALKGIDLTILKGEFVAVWGPSGSGKSTLCHLIGVIDTPTSGRVIIATVQGVGAHREGGAAGVV